MRRIILIFGLIILIVVTGLSGLFLIKRDKPISPAYVSPKQTQAVKESISATSSVIAPQNTTSSAKTLQTATTSLKTYHNKQYGFEFQYPGNWKIIENPYGSPYSQFNLIAVPASGKYFPDPIAINIVIPKFIDMEYADLQSVGTKEKINGTEGIRYEYENEGLPQLDII
jgi:hypothetical protein